MKERRFFPESLWDEESVFYLFCTEQKDDHAKASRQLTYDVWFVNNSKEVLNAVRPASGGVMTTDEDEMIQTQPTPEGIEYADLRPGEAVLVGDFDLVHDSDFVFQWTVDVRSVTYGDMRLSEHFKKGKPPTGTVFWRPLHEEMKDPLDQDKIVTPENAARAYRDKSGMGLPVGTFINKGDFVSGQPEDRLAPSGLRLERKSRRGGKVTEHRFLDAENQLVFGTHDPDRAVAFARALVL